MSTKWLDQAVFRHPLPAGVGGCARGLAVKQRLSNKQAQRNNTFFFAFTTFPRAPFRPTAVVKI